VPPALLNGRLLKCLQAGFQDFKLWEEHRSPKKKAVGPFPNFIESKLFAMLRGPAFRQKSVVGSRKEFHHY
jgi:hypothetical protein